jgi:hypothetical protein
LAIVGVPNEGSTLAWLRNHLLQRSVLETTDHVNFFTGKSLSRTLACAGLSVRTVARNGFFVPHQRMHGWLTSTRTGRDMLDRLGRLFPDQASDLIATAVRQ